MLWYQWRRCASSDRMNWAKSHCMHLDRMTSLVRTCNKKPRNGPLKMHLAVGSTPKTDSNGFHLRLSYTRLAISPTCVAVYLFLSCISADKQAFRSFVSEPSFSCSSYQLYLRPACLSLYLLTQPLFKALFFILGTNHRPHYPDTFHSTPCL